MAPPARVVFRFVSFRCGGDGFHSLRGTIRQCCYHSCARASAMRIARKRCEDCAQAQPQTRQGLAVAGSHATSRPLPHSPAVVSGLTPPTRRNKLAIGASSLKGAFTPGPLFPAAKRSARSASLQASPRPSFPGFLQATYIRSTQLLPGDSAHFAQVDGNVCAVHEAPCHCPKPNRFPLSRAIAAQQAKGVESVAIRTIRFHAPNPAAAQNLWAVLIFTIQPGSRRNDEAAVY